MSRESFAGKRQAEDCRDCEAARGGGEDEDVTGWQLHSDGCLHNHLRGSTFTRADGAVIHADDPQWCADYHGPEEYDALLEETRTLMRGAAAAPAAAARLTPEEVAIAGQMGLSEQQVLATKRLYREREEG